MNIVVTDHARQHWRRRCGRRVWKQGDDWTDMEIVAAAEAGRLPTHAELQAVSHWLVDADTFHSSTPRRCMRDHRDQFIVDDMKGVVFVLVFEIEEHTATITSVVPLREAMAKLIEIRRQKKKRRERWREHRRLGHVHIEGD